MAGTASVLMRAYRIADGSYHTWRAGDYDPTMSDAVGDQAPPFPVIDYSDFVRVGTVEGPLARTDATSFAVPGLGTVGVPVAFPLPAAPLIETSPGTDCRDFASISYWVSVAVLGGGAQVSVSVLWGAEAAPSGGIDYGYQNSDDQIVAGASPQATYVGEFDLTGGTTLSFGPFNVPVRGRFARLSVSSDNGLVQGYVRAIRFA